MRETEFRGRRLDNGEWVYGDLCCHYENQRRFIACDQMFYTHAECGIARLASERFHEVDPATVGQYTGLKDKGGQEIYEGDILKDTLGWVFGVRWDDDNGKFLGYHSKPRGDTYICYVGREPKSTIIGNIHDNPELLKGG